MVSTEIDWYVNTSESMSRLAAPVGRDHNYVVPTSLSQAKSEYTTACKKFIIEKAEIGISNYSRSQSWDCVTVVSDPNKKAPERSHSGEMVLRLSEHQTLRDMRKHC